MLSCCLYNVCDGNRETECSVVQTFGTGPEAEGRGVTSADTSGAGSFAGKVSADWTLAAAESADNEESDVDEEDDEEDFQFQSGAFHHGDAASGGEEVGTTCKDAEQSFSR